MDEIFIFCCCSVGNDVNIFCEMNEWSIFLLWWRNWGGVGFLLMEFLCGEFLSLDCFVVGGFEVDLFVYEVVYNDVIELLDVVENVEVGVVCYG